jgi:hypothetical protein
MKQLGWGLGIFAVIAGIILAVKKLCEVEF